MPDNSAVIQRHAVMVRWQNQGLLICGPPAIGKSSLALAILHQGGQLIADDCVDITRREARLIAQCPANQVGLLHSRELGLLNIRSLFAYNAVLAETPIDAIIKLLPEPPKQLAFSPDVAEQILGIQVQILTLSVLNPLSLTERIALWLRQWPTKNEV
ncbi:MAG: HPr kinase/phosphatase C-terminal domain-containing protein [Methylophaga sp.]|nr:HPr kinase/phosphatase C-terminal domain-containing protein [Methylophaga sp.]